MLAVTALGADAGQLSALAAGLVASTFGVRAALVAGVAGLLLPPLILLFSPVPELRAGIPSGQPR